MTVFIEIIQEGLRKMQIIATESFATFRHVLPCAIKWWIRKNITRGISAYLFKSVENNVETKGTLYLHGELNIVPGEEFQPLLFIHGDYGHPFMLLHLIDIAKNISKR